MEYVLLALAASAVWFLFLPARILSRVGRLPLVKPGVVAVIFIIGWVLIAGLRGEAPPTADYAQGDAALRAMLD